MDAGNIIYIIAIIIYFIYTALKKGKGPEDVNTPENPEQEAPRKQVSFDDLLREIREGQQERERDFEESGQGEVIESKPVRKQKEVQQARRADSYQPQSIDQPKEFHKFQGEIADVEKPKLKTLDEQVKLNSKLEGLKSTIEVEELEEVSGMNKYKSLLKNPETVKEAVVLSEILNRKHF
ncbi:hypothetical protein A33Q_1032 [Indibacter alkaliphilus LW1]|uniref:Uncharacterized protein n=1 Tax=Indibacter alkaliphilus (strain CCUG 57479 / KCTC 22604 / LW1) TaxID=1189612 RepID=S2E7W9_INDAL|nr:hypothetical protein [Indibacter alkaliphilus]EOZ98378.1 hypothetical protein A33Q_1032 [Indibacter alkaliphilus LW1]